jgi:hypothetical protein
MIKFWCTFNFLLLGAVAVMDNILVFRRGKNVSLNLLGKSMKALLPFVTTCLCEIKFYVVAAMKQNFSRG